MPRAPKFAALLLLSVSLIGAAPAVFAAGTENFSHFSYSGASYSNGTFLGQDGSSWIYTECQGSKVINAPTPGLNRGTPIAYVESGLIAGGCGELSFDWMQMFSPTVSVDVVINGTIRRTWTITNAVQNVVTNSGQIVINQTGSFQLRIQQHSTQSRQVAIDNIAWTSYGGSAPEPPDFIFDPETNGVVTAYSNAVQLDVTATEPNDDMVRLWAANLPAGAAFPGATGTAAAASSFLWTPTSAQTGLYSVIFYAGDKDGTNSRTFSIEVTPIYPYYHYAVGLTGAALKAKLQDIISTGAHQLGDEGSDNELDRAMKAIHADPTNSNNVLYLYNPTSSVAKTLYNDDRGWNKEHCWPQSLGLSGSGPDVVDAHNLYAEDKYVNILRANLLYDESNTNDPAYRNPATNAAPETSMDSNSWEPPPASKGNVARALFYMSTRYDGSDGRLPLELSNAPNGTNQMGILTNLLLWHAMDPPDAWESNRNELIYSHFQSNRNPFVDHPEWVEQIWGTDTDGDGVTDTHEIIAGTAANNSNSVFEATPASTQIVCGLLSSGSVWRLYQGSFVSNDIVWQAVAETNRLQSGTVSFNVTPTSPATYYHLRALRP
jgi:endonuclease I